MELKVWVEGIQRVVCGVTETSTCQDVVYALAHATGQTGRFTLIEKWRNSERLLAPQEQPLKVLIKWGEYANDVHFVMRKTTGDSKQSTNQPVNNNKRQHDFLRSFSPSGSSNNNNSIGKTTKIAVNNNTSKEIKKSLTFSCGHGSSGSSVSSNENNSAIISEQDASLNKNIKNRSKQDLPKGVVRGVPQKPPRDSDSPTAKIERPKFPPSYDEALSRSSGRFSTSHLSIANSNQPDEESPLVKRPHLSNSSSPRPTTTFRSPTTEVLSSPNRAGEKSSVPDESVKPKKTLKFDKQETKPLSLKSTSSEEITHDPQYQDLLRLVSLQREKLDNQQAELSQFDAEIVYWEGRLQEQEEKLNLLQEEVCLLERTQREQEGELIQLDRRSFTEEVELGRQEERTLRSELTLARSQLANCETEVLQCRQRIRLLLEEIAEGRRLHEEQQMDSLQRQIKEKILQADNQKCAADDAKEELQDLEVKVADKQKEMDKLLAEIREANLHSLSLLPSEEGKKLFEGNFCNRPGSTRKIIGSPRQLENAVPTNKNPHGVWV